MIAPEDIPEPDRIEGAPHPRHTAELFGQEAAEAAFLQAYNGGRLHHAWLITGPRGVGKATLAWKIARFLLSQPKEAGGGLFGEPILPDSLFTPPDSPTMRRTSALSEPGLFLCRRPWDDKAERLKRDITVDEIRRLKEFFNFSATEGGRRVLIIDAADEMNNSAANALLKILEEPPVNVTILLVSHQPMRLLATIRSRCRILKCAPLGPDALDRALAGAGYDAGGEVDHLAVLAAGSVGEAIRLLSGEGPKLYTLLLSLFAGKHPMERPAAIALAESCTGKAGQERYDLALGLLDILLHRLAITGVSGPIAPAAAPSEQEALTALSPSPKAARDWAELAQKQAARVGHARAVNLDPASVILDMLLKIDQTARALKTA